MVANARSTCGLCRGCPVFNSHGSPCFAPHVGQGLSNGPLVCAGLVKTLIFAGFMGKDYAAPRSDSGLYRTRAMPEQNRPVMDACFSDDACRASNPPQLFQVS